MFEMRGHVMSQEAETIRASESPLELGLSTEDPSIRLHQPRSSIPPDPVRSKPAPRTSAGHSLHRDYSSAERWGDLAEWQNWG